MADNGKAVIDLDRQRMEAMCRQDVEALNKLLADDLVYIRSSARIDTKQSLIGNMQSGSTVYSKIDASEVQARDLGDAVVLTGVARISVGSAGRTQNFGVRFADVYANQGGRWQMVHWQSPRLPE